MKPLALDDLPAHSEWAAYLLDPEGEPPRDPLAYSRSGAYEEYGAVHLESYRSAPTDPDQFLRRMRGYGRSEPDVISIDEELLLSTTGELLDRERTTVREALAPVLDGGETVVDLGCGWGYTLGWITDAFRDVTAVGGEYGPPAVELCRALYGDHDRLSIEPFDVRGEWDLLEAPDGDVVVFTRGSLTTMDDVAAIVDRFADRATDGSVVAGVHLEQVHAHPETTLGLLRRHYGRVRGYNGALLDALETHDDLSVTAVEYDVVGRNPLHPHTLVRWRPK